jgi:hypothetical protein
VLIDTTAAPEFTRWFQETLRPQLEAWYPVLVDRYAYPDYKPPTTITIKADPTYDGIAEGGGQLIRFNTKYLRTSSSDVPGALIHEATHVVEVLWANSPMPSWVAEGMADHAREYIYKDRSLRALRANETYRDGYTPAARLLQYAETKSPGFIHSVATSGYNRTYNDAIFQQKTGMTTDELWAQMTGR